MPTIEEREKLFPVKSPHESGFSPRYAARQATQRRPRSIVDVECQHQLRCDSTDTVHGRPSLTYRLWLEAGRLPVTDGGTTSRPDVTANSTIWRNFRRQYSEFLESADPHSHHSPRTPPAPHQSNASRASTVSRASVCSPSGPAELRHSAHSLSVCQIASPTHSVRQDDSRSPPVCKNDSHSPVVCQNDSCSSPVCQSALRSPSVCQNTCNSTPVPQNAPCSPPVCKSDLSATAISASNPSVSESVASMHPITVPPPSTVGDYTYARFLSENPLIKDAKRRRAVIQQVENDLEEFKQLKLRSELRDPPLTKSGEIAPPPLFRHYSYYSPPELPPIKPPSPSLADRLNRVDIFGRYVPKADSLKGAHRWKLEYYRNNPEYKKVQEEMDRWKSNKGNKSQAPQLAKQTLVLPPSNVLMT